MKKIGIAVVGCGIISPWHIKSILLNKDAKLVSVCDNIEKKAKEVARKYGVNWYTDYRKLLKRKDLNIVCLCSPSSLHAEQTVLAAKAGKHVLTEKPIAVTLKDADKMINACKKAKVKLGVIFQRRTDPKCIRIKQALERNELGKLVLADVYVKYYRGQEYYDSADWRGTWKFDGGGCLMNPGIHLVDLMLWFMGPVDTVFGYAKHILRKIEVDDTAVAVVKFKNGAMGVIEGATSIYPANIPHRFEIHGEKGTIMWEGEDIVRWDVKDKSGCVKSKLSEIRKIRSVPIISSTDIGMEGHRKQIFDFIEAIKNDRVPMVTGEEARKSIELVISLYKSNKINKPVKI